MTRLFVWAPVGGAVGHIREKQLLSNRGGLDAVESGRHGDDLIRDDSLRNYSLLGYF